MRALRPPPTWLFLLGVILAVFGTVAGRYWDFTVDDAGITFAASRSLAQGFGLVLFRDGERVEAATNLLWCLLLTPATWLGVAHETLAKVLGLAGASLALSCVAFFPSAAYQRKPRYYDLVAPLLASLMPNFALWSISGLESGLMAGLLAASLLALAWEEGDPARTPWSAVLLTATFATRPDGLLYLAAVGSAKLLRQLVPRPRRQDLYWGVLVLALFGLLELSRLAYFAWPFPNSYYTKRRTWDFGKDLFDTTTAGWVYVGSWLETYKVRRLMTLVPLLLLGRGAPAARIGLLATVGAVFFFPIYSHGDWMEEWRFLSWGVPVLCLGAAEAVRAVVHVVASTLAALPVLEHGARWVTRLATPVLAALLLHEGVQHYPERMRAASQHQTLEFRFVQGRARYFVAAARRMHVDGRAGMPSLLDPDVGGLCYDGRLRVVDLFGLGEVAVAHAHPVDPAGTREFLFWERRPDFVHLHGAWLAAMELERMEELSQGYLRLPMVIESESENGYNWVRRESIAAPWYLPASLLTDPAGSGPDAFTVSHSGVEPNGRVVIELTYAPGGAAGVVTARPAGSGRTVQSPVLLAGGLLDATQFLAGERPRARVELARLPEGRYALSWRDSVGRELSLGSLEVATGAARRDALAVQAQLQQALEAQDFTRALAFARRLGLRLVATPDDAVAREALGLYGRALGARARQLANGGATELAALLAREARAWAWHDHGTLAQVNGVAEVLLDASRERLRRGARAEAFVLARDSVLLDPRRSWGRRRAEELRPEVTGRYDGGRDQMAYRIAAQALTGGADRDDALAWLGSVDRPVEAAALADRFAARGHRPTSALARVAVARGLVARGQWTEALALVAQLPCSEAHDPGLSRALRVAFARRFRQGDAACEAPVLDRAPFDDAQGSFEQGSYRGWTSIGSGFGPAPVRARSTHQQWVNGYRGQWFASSFRGDSDDARGTLRSAPFTLRAPSLSFLVGGGSDTARVGVRLRLDGQTVRQSAGQNHEGLHREFWDVREFQGRVAVLEVYDDTTGSWGHVMADDFREELALPLGLASGALNAPSAPPVTPPPPVTPAPLPMLAPQRGGRGFAAPRGH